MGAEVTGSSRAAILHTQQLVAATTTRQYHLIIQRYLTSHTHSQTLPLGDRIHVDSVLRVLGVYYYLPPCLSYTLEPGQGGSLVKVVAFLLDDRLRAGGGASLYVPSLPGCGAPCRTGDAQARPL